jgi:hypothetical protein
MSVIERFEDLPAWQEARKLVHAVYQMTKEFPSNEHCEKLSRRLRDCVERIERASPEPGGGWHIEEPAR